MVSESVLEIKKLLQTQEAEHTDIIIQMAKLFDMVKEPGAKAAIVWVVEYSERIPLHAPPAQVSLTWSSLTRTMT